MRNQEIECPGCHYRRSMPGDVIPQRTTVVTCPRCGDRFTHHHVVRDQQVLSETRGQKSTLYDTPGSHRSITIDFGKMALIAASLLAFLTLVTALLYVFVGRIHFYEFPAIEATVLKGWKYADSAQSEKIGTPVPDVMVFVSVSVKARYRFYWGDGSNQGVPVKETLFYTYTDADGKVRFPDRKHWTYIKGGMGRRYEDEITALYIAADYKDLGVQKQAEEPPVYIKSRDDLVYKLNDKSAKPLWPEDKKRRALLAQ